MVDATKKRAVESLGRTWPELTDLEKMKLMGMLEGLEIKVEWAHRQADTAGDKGGMIDQFCRNFNRTLAEKGITPAELSRRTGISRASLSQYQSGKNKPSKARIKLIADALEVDPEALYKEPEPELDEAGKRSCITLNLKWPRGSWGWAWILCMRG